MGSEKWFWVWFCCVTRFPNFFSWLQEDGIRELGGGGGGQGQGQG